VTFKSKYDEGTERMSIRIPAALKNHIWKAAKKNRMTATDVVITILTDYFANNPPAPKAQPGTTKIKKEKPNEKDVFA
jgi:hypothetical protein